MQDSELKKLLLETCPILPGQENRAWLAFQEQLQGADSSKIAGGSPFISWRSLSVAVGALAVICLIGDYVVTSAKPMALATVESQSPEIYATAFYSDSAQAQVVQLKGMDPATDKLTYLDHSTVISNAADKNTSPAGDPNSL